jgi:fibronectin type 3 domain-containing protein
MNSTHIPTPRLASVVLLALLCAAPLLHAQKRGIPAVPVYTSPGGMYVYCGITIASAAHPVADTVGYRIERRTGGEWTKVADVSAVATLDAFRASIGDSLLLRIRHYLKAPSDAAVWDTVVSKPGLNHIPYNSNLRVLHALGSIVLDKDVVKGTRYEYRVSALLRSGGVAAPRISEPTEFGARWHIGSMRFFSKEETDSSATILWWTPQPTPVPTFFHVYRRMTGKEQFTLLPLRGFVSFKHDSLVCIVRDTKLVRNQQYDYYVVPEDFVGNIGPESNRASAFTVNATRLPLPQNIKARHDSAGVHLTWQTRGRDLVLSTRIYRSMNFDNGFERIAEVPGSDSAYYDQSARGMIRYYYRMQNVTYDNRASQMSATIFGYFVTTAPPITPTGLAAKEVKRGVELTWMKTEQEDVAGWYVYRCDRASDTVGAVVSPFLQEPRFLDTSATLKGSIEYRYTVVALNTSQKRSLPSAEVRARPLIATNPKPPREIAARQVGDVIAVTWDDARAYEPYVTGYALFRLKKGDNPSSTREIARWKGDPERLTYLDSAVVPGTPYIYAVTSIDAFGYEGIRSAGAEARVQITVCEPPQVLHAAATDKGVLVEWDRVYDERAASFVLYRYARGAAPVRIATPSIRDRSYADFDVVTGQVYYYQLSIVNNKGQEGPKSPAVYTVP